MKNIFYIMLLIITVTVFSFSCNKSESVSQGKSESNSTVEKVGIKNFTLTFNKGLEKASNEKKNMLVDFYTDWCHWCKVMDEKTFNNPEIAKKLSERFVTVRLNAESRTETATFKGKKYDNIELTGAFRVRGFPSLAFISSEQEIITVIPGYIPPETFTLILDYIDQECYKKQMSFEEFMKKKGECEDSLRTEKRDAKI